MLKHNMRRCATTCSSAPPRILGNRKDRLHAVQHPSGLLMIVIVGIKHPCPGGDQAGTVHFLICKHHMLLVDCLVQKHLLCRS